METMLHERADESDNAAEYDEDKDEDYKFFIEFELKSITQLLFTRVASLVLTSGCYEFVL